jgi:leucine-zipper of insertion element IS481
MTHRDAPLSETGRLRLARCVVDDGWPLRRAAGRFQVSPTAAQRWADRYRHEGAAGMADRSSRPVHSPRRTPTRAERIGKEPMSRWSWTSVHGTCGLGRVVVIARIWRHRRTNNARRWTQRTCRLDLFLNGAPSVPRRSYRWNMFRGVVRRTLNRTVWNLRGH